jgi:hypothetical protein
MGDFKVAYEGLQAEQAYVRDTGIAQASISKAIEGFPADVAHWGPWEALKPPMVAAFQSLDATNSTAAPGLGSVADLLHQVLAAYQDTEIANTVTK